VVRGYAEPVCAASFQRGREVGLEGGVVAEGRGCGCVGGGVAGLAGCDGEVALQEVGFDLDEVEEARCGWRAGTGR